jgi:hypothetical protein
MMMMMMMMVLMMSDEEVFQVSSSNWKNKASLFRFLINK